jgi:L-alanine-DL-glutamate epimerase-like enolase superfamily enzyme
LKITNVETKIIPIKLNAPFKTALRTVQAVDVYRVSIYFDNGIVGFGEAAPTKVITGDTEQSIAHALKDVFTPFLIGKELDESLTILDELKLLLDHNTSPKAAIDIALHDALAKAKNVPLYRLLGGTNPTLATDFTISINGRDKMIQDATEKVGQGFQSLKIKMGLDEVAEEIAKIRSINEVLEGKIPFRIDANQGWTKEEAVQILSEWQDVPIEFVEQPVKAADFAGLKYVTERTTIPIMADESLFGIEDAKTLIADHCVDLLNIKLMKSTGLKDGRKIYELAKANGIGCMVGSMIEGYAGMAAAAHFAAGCEGIKFYDLDVPFMWETNHLSTKEIGFEIKQGSLHLLETPGLGIEC